MSMGDGNPDVGVPLKGPGFRFGFCFVHFVCLFLLESGASGAFACKRFTREKTSEKTNREGRRGAPLDPGAG